MKKILIAFLLPLLLASVKLYGQSHFFLEASGNWPIIPKVEEEGEYTIPVWGGSNISVPFLITESFETKPGFNVLFGYQMHIFKKIGAELGIEFSSINYQRTSKIDDLSGTFSFDEGPFESGPSYIYNYLNTGIWDTNDSTFLSPFHPPDSLAADIPDDNSNTIGKTNLIYLAIPININYDLINNRLNIGLGISPSVLIYSKHIDARLNFTENGVVQEGIADKSKEEFNTLLILGNVDLKYRLINKLWINAAYQHSFSPIYDKEVGLANEAKSRIIKLGLRYYL